MVGEERWAITAMLRPRRIARAMATGHANNDLRFARGESLMYSEASHRARRERREKNPSSLLCSLCVLCVRLLAKSAVNRVSPSPAWGVWAEETVETAGEISHRQSLCVANQAPSVSAR